MEGQESVDNQIDELVKENMIHRFASELQNTTGEERKKEIREILQILQRTKNIENDLKGARDKLKKIYDNIDNEALKRKWNRLTALQKQNRIKDFLKTTIKDEKTREITEKKIISMLEEGKLKQKFVEYDHLMGKISSVNIPSDEKKKIKKVKSDSSKSNSSDTDSSTDSESVSEESSDNESE